jgi:hypothetical protein
MSKAVVVDKSSAELLVTDGPRKGAGHTVVSYSNTEKPKNKLLVERPDAMRLDEC